MERLGLGGRRHGQTLHRGYPATRARPSRIVGHTAQCDRNASSKGKNGAFHPNPNWCRQDPAIMGGFADIV